MPFGYPVMLEVRGRRTVVIGDEAVRAGKVEGLLAAGADDVLVIAEGPAARLDELETVDGVTVERRAWKADDLNGAALCIAAIADEGERGAIAREARCRRTLVNVVDDIPNCDWSAPAVVRRGELVLAIATGGSSPAIAKRLREELSDEFGEEWAGVLDVVRSVRAETGRSLSSLTERARRWGAALDLEEAATLVREGRSDELAARLRERLTSEETTPR
jgi:precorrin-2 dehydrogenase / sirohydrochlorin ferrochelatase